MIDENFVFGYHAVIEALKEGRGINYLWQRMPEGKNRWVKRSCSRTVCPSQVGAKTKARSNEQSRRPSKCDFSDHPYEYLSLDELLAQTKEQSFYLILDNLEDPHNFGSILRTADASGVDGIIIPKHRAVGITPVVVKTSTGAVEHIPIARVTNLSQAIQQLKQAGFGFLERI